MPAPKFESRALRENAPGDPRNPAAFAASNPDCSAENAGNPPETKSAPYAAFPRPPKREKTVTEVAAFGPGTNWTAPCLYLEREHPGRGGSWIFRYQSPVLFKQTDFSLGPYALIGTPQAKALVLKLRVAVLEGRCPLTERRTAEAARRAALASKAPTFRSAFDLYLTAHQRGWRSAVHRAQWSSTVETYAYPVLADLAVDRIGTGEVMRVLEPIWYEKPETASRVRSRIENVLDYCGARHWRAGENPARWKGHIAKLLPAREKVKPEQHHAALPWRQLPALYQKLAQQKDASALALRYTLLTLLRTSETLGTPAEGEIDRAGKTHVVPPERMKANREHRVPLAAEALAVIAQAETIRTGSFLFNGAKGGPLSNMALLQKLRGLFPDQRVTTHGLRSGFRDWCSEHGVSRELAERQLAHVVRDATEAAYLRTDALDPRRTLMERWSTFLLAPVVEAGDKVVPIGKGKAAAQ